MSVRHVEAFPIADIKRSSISNSSWRIFLNGKRHHISFWHVFRFFPLSDQIFNSPISMSIIDWKYSRRLYCIVLLFCVLKKPLSQLTCVEMESSGDALAPTVSALQSSLRENYPCTKRRIVGVCVNSFETKVNMKNKIYLSKVCVVKARNPL